MRGAVSIALALGGLATSGAAFVRSTGPVKPASPWSLSERLLAVRLDRTLPPHARRPATLALVGDHAVFKVREAAGPSLLKCPLGAGSSLAEAFASYTSTGAPSGCESQAVDEAGDVLVYEVSGHVAPLCPGQYTTLTEQQLHHALFLPALRFKDAASAPASILKPGTFAACAPGQTDCALSKAASALLYCGVVATCAEGSCFQGRQGDVQPDDVAASLYYSQALAQAKVPSTVAPASCGPVPMSVHLSSLVSEAVTATSAAKFIEAQPWASAALVGRGSTETADELRDFFNRQPRGICFYVRGVDVDRRADAEMVAQSLSFPVFAPHDPRASGRASPLLRALYRAANDEPTMFRVFERCDLPSERACRQKRERIASQLRAALGKLEPALGNLSADEIPYHVGASGPFQLADYDALHVSLQSAAEVPKAGGGRGRMMVHYQPLWPESVADKRLQCQQQQGGICLFRALWDLRSVTKDPARRRPTLSSESSSEDGFESLVALFARRDANTRCLRRLFDGLAASGDDRLLELQRELREPVGAGENRAPCDPRARAAGGLVPKEETFGGGCPVTQATAPFGSDASAEACRPISLVYVQEEPWAAAAQKIASIAKGAGIAVSVSGVKASEVHRGTLASWDVLLTVASNYYNRKYPTLVPLLHPTGNQNLSGGQAISESPGRSLLTSYESSIVFPPPAWLGAPDGAPQTRAESLRLLEEDVAKKGPAPIYPLAFLHPGTLSVPEAQASAAQGSWYFSQLLDSWKGQP